MNLNKLKVVVDNSNAIFKKLKTKYPNLDGYLVFSSPYGQCELVANPAEILNSFPQMVVDCRQKGKGIQLYEKINSIEEKNRANRGNPKSTEDLRQQLDEVVKNLELKEDTFVEIRFRRADWGLIFKLQQDELISQQHTLQTKASIRIVLGTIEELYFL